ncbi:hypothetical protein ZIOFF_034673 [Zingiber officinale]|uniref:LOB domain-containing protein n=1 Tax=Zingiber officinale TaxID=94328 RepID=A0A8J5GSQ6_ZINOF|nr:hypothetical protein ZIOFF_034673 [Zingiber officinale]
MKKILERLLPHQRAVAMATMIYESEVHAASRDTGCLDIILQLHSQIERRAADLDHLRRNLSLPSPTPALGTAIAGNGEIIIPPTTTGNLKRRCQDLPENERKKQRRR